MLIGMQTSAYTPYQAYQAFSKSDRSVKVAYEDDDVTLNPVKEDEEAKELRKETEAKKALEKEQKAEEQKEEAARAAEKREANKPEVTKFTGYTDAQLKQLWQDGRISYQKMAEEMEKRSEERKERTETSEAAFDKMDDAIISSMVQKTDIGLILPENFVLDEDEKIGLSA